MEAQIAITVFRSALALLALVRNFTAKASPAALKEFVDGVHAAGGDIDIDVLKGVQDDVKASGAALDALILSKKAGQ